MDNESATTQNMIWYLTYHIVGACLGSCMKRCLRCITLIRSESTRFVASWSKLIALPGLREYTPWTHGTRKCPYSHYLYTRRHSECPDGAQRIADINMTVSTDVIPDAFNAFPRPFFFEGAVRQHPVDWGNTLVYVENPLFLVTSNGHLDISYTRYWNNTNFQL